jgi:N5-(cytidine 5'-diphosphoramidyl)-L-glutamine hydrolase
MKCLVSGRYLESIHGEYHLSVSLNLLTYIKAQGFDPTPIWAETQVGPSEIDLSGFDLVVLSGGESIGENPVRDSFENSLLKAAIASRTPVLGICRGLQVMMSFYGLSPIRLEGHAGTRHSVEGRISGNVNSHHDFGFNDVSDGFEVISSALDRSVEAAYHKENNWLGVMWHPERQMPYNQEHTNQILEIMGLS